MGAFLLFRKGAAMQDMFHNHFAQESLPEEIISLLDMLEALQAFSRALRSMQIPTNNINKALTDELIETAQDVGILVALFESNIDVKLKEYYNVTK